MSNEVKMRIKKHVTIQCIGMNTVWLKTSADERHFGSCKAIYSVLQILVDFPSEQEEDELDNT